jgi:hypothetical protein
VDETLRQDERFRSRQLLRGSTKYLSMVHDSEYFRRRAAEARAAASAKDFGENAEVAGDLARAYAALAKRRAAAAAVVEETIEAKPALALDD